VEKLLRLFALLLLTPVALYLLAALAGSHVPRNGDWQQAKEGVTIHVATNGWHSAIIVPVAAAGEDWSLIFRPTDLAEKEQAGNALLIGWGDRDFFLNTPEWSDLAARTMVTAAVGSGGSLIHVDHLDSPADLPDARPVVLSVEEYKRLTAVIRGSLVLDQDGKPAAQPGYGARDVFYPARGRYSLRYTCNSWTADALAEAGVRVAWWTPFSGGVMRWF
jgi:uncharacterized protein (TIGR02117 family)